MISTSVNANIVADVEMVKEITDESSRNVVINDLLTEYGNRGVQEFVRLSGEFIKNRIRLKLTEHPKAWALTLKYAEEILDMRRNEVYDRLHKGLLEG